jgi:hypothetical protein
MVGNSVSLHNFCVLKVQVQGLSVNIPNNLNKSFSQLLWSYWALSPFKYSPPLFIHPSQCFFQFWKHSWNTSFRKMRSSASTFSLISLTDSNHPFIKDFSLVKRKKSAGANSGEYRVQRMSIVSHFVRKSQIGRGGIHWNIVMMKQPFFPPFKNQAFSSSLPLSAFSSPSDKIACSLSGHKIEIHDELHCHNQKSQHHFHIGTNLPSFFWVWVKILRPIMKNGILLQYHRCKPKFHHL